MAGMLTQALHLHFCWNIRSDSGIRRQIVEFNLIKLEDHLKPAETSNYWEVFFP